MTHPWHDVPIGAAAPKEFQAVIENYKILEEKEVAVHDFFGPVEAVDTVRSAMAAYDRTMREKAADPNT